MAKPNKGGMKRIPGREAPVTPKPNGESLIVRSAESLGRMIGALQRELEEVAARARAGNATPVKKRAPASRKTTGKGQPRHTQGKAASNAKGGSGQP